MICKSRTGRVVSTAVAALLACAWGSSALAAERTVVSAKSDADYTALRAEAVAAGARVVKDMRQIGAFVVQADAKAKSVLAASTHANGIGPDRVVKLVRNQMKQELFGVQHANPLLAARSGATPSAPRPVPSADPGNRLPGLMWNLDRIDAPTAWTRTTGVPGVTVGVADTGLDYTHPELAARVSAVVDFTGSESPAICATYFGFSDADLAATYGGPADTDWNGHGSWIGGNIAASLDGQGINGIAPNVTLVALKISQWCGSAYDSEILDAFLYAADHGIDIVSISFGGYLDRSDPEQDAIYRQYVAAVRYATLRGTVIVASAGNEHVRVGEGGRVLSHGSLTIPGDPVEDLFGLFETPAGIPGVIDVAATGNRVEAPSSSCTAATSGSSAATCKPTTDAHQATGVGSQDQLAYYSNYGPRIDVAAPGGARKFNVPGYDRGGTPGFPVTTADGTKAWETFSITSNWALEIPCYVFSDPAFYADSCYSTIQGTSMATPHVSATMALIASATPALRHRPLLLKAAMLASARPVRGNKTQPLSATDISAGDLTGVPCMDQTGATSTSGYCHLGGAPISDSDAYGAGVVNARAVARGDD